MKIGQACAHVPSAHLGAQFPIHRHSRTACPAGKRLPGLVLFASISGWSVPSIEIDLMPAPLTER
jgi:hypothetical protein